jgi:flagellar motor switch protein FliG
MDARGAVMSVTESIPMSGVRKAAILVSLLGEDPAAPILRNLPEDVLQLIAEEVASLPSVPLDITLEVLEEFHEIMRTQEFLAEGGRDVASRLLTKAFGENGAKPMMERIQRDEEQNSLGVDSLRKADPQQLARFLAGEHSQTKALVLGYLDAKQASALLMKMEPKTRSDCIRRLASIGQCSPGVATKVSAVLNRRLKTAGDQRKQNDFGFKNVAELMNRLDAPTAREVLDDIEREEPMLAISIRDFMFTFEDFLEVPEAQLRELMSSLDKKTLMIALKGASEDLRSRFYRTMSSRAVDMMKEDAESMGPVRAKEVAKAQSEIVAIGRKLESEGKIVLKSEGEDEYVL